MEEVDLLHQGPHVGDGFSGKLQVSSPLYWDSAFIEPIILAFNRRYPGVKVEMNICDPLEGLELLVRGKTDLCAGFEFQARRSDVEAGKLADDRLCVTMSAEHPLAGRSSVSLRELAGERFLLLDMDESHMRGENAIYTLLLNHGISPDRVTFSQNPSAVGLTSVLPVHKRQIRHGAGIQRMGVVLLISRTPVISSQEPGEAQLDAVIRREDRR